MNRRHLLCGVALLATVAVTPALAAPQSADADARFAALVAASRRADDALHPLRIARRGEKPTGPAFVDPLSDAYAKALEANRTGDLAALAGINRADLSPGTQTAYDIFRYQTEQSVEEFRSGVFAIGLKAPLNASFGLHVEFPDYAAGVVFATTSDYETGLAQLEGFSVYMATAVDRLRQGMGEGYFQSRVVIDNVLLQVNALLAVPIEDSPFYSPVKRFPEAVSADDRVRLEAAYRLAVETRVYAGYRLWQEFLSQTYLPVTRPQPGLWAMKDGDAVYASALKRHTTTRIGADEVHQIGIGEVARIRAEMEGARRDAGFDGDLPAFFEFIRTDPQFYYKEPSELIARMEGIADKIYLKMPELFRRRPIAAFTVAPLPALGDQRGTGYFRVGSPDGSRPGVLYFNMAMLNTRPIPTLETLTLHEGIPGHHYQGSLVLEDTSLPDLLRFRTGPMTAYSEGWALYAESLGKDLGMFTDPYQWFGHLDMEMLRAVRLVVDTGLHAKQWSRQRAIDYMLANTSMAERDVAVEIDRYLSNPAQACAYKIGELRIQALRKRAQTTLGDRFDIRDFHDAVLDKGPLPLDLLETKIDGWISSVPTA